MARKDRTPNPPKRPPGPQSRSAAGDSGRQRRLLYLIAGAGIVALAVVVGVIALSGGGGDDDERSVLEAAGCTLESYPAQANVPDHSDVPDLASTPKWNSSPPTSGPHYGQPAVWGSYDEPVPLVQSTHNLEHGGVIVHFGPQVPEAEVDRVRAWYAEDPNGLIVAPLPSNGDAITLSAWTAPDATINSRDRGKGWLASCTEFDQAAFDAFLEAHRFQGPERFPSELLAPGS
jgi:hypothetical protein